MIAQDSFASGSGGGAGRYLESGAVLTAAGIDETKRMLASKREAERTEGLKRVIAVSFVLSFPTLPHIRHLANPPSLYVDDD